MQSSSKAREELERSAWSWVDKIEDSDNDKITDENLHYSYRLFFPVHTTPGWKCKKNCRSNPRCYCGLGEAQWVETPTGTPQGANSKVTNGDSKNHDNEEDEEDMSLERRLNGKKFSHTCFWNSF